jgi:hypothetical protein
VKLSHTLPATSAVFDDPNLVSAAGLVPVLALADRAGLRRLADEHLSVPGDKGANAGLKVASLVAGMVAGADSIDDMALLRHGGMGRVFARAYAPSTLGSFLRSFTFGHVRQLDALASRFLTRLAAQGERAAQVVGDGTGGRVLVDIDDTIIQVHGHAKQGAGFGYSGVRGLNALLATVTTTGSAPVVVAQRLRKGSCGSPRGAKRLVADALKTVRTLHPGQGKPLLRADSAFYGAPTVGAAVRAGAQVSVTVRLDPKVKAAITTISEHAWTPIEYTDAIYDEASGTWVSRAEVAEVPFTAFSSKKAADQVPGRLVVRRIPDVNADKKKATGQGTLFDTCASTPSSPPPTPPTWTPSPRIRPTADTRSSSRSTPTSRTPPWRTCPQANSPPTPPGSCWPSSRSTSPAPQPPSPAPTSPEPPPPPSAAS